MRVAFTLEQCWHAVPGGTAVAAIELARALEDRGTVELVGVAAHACAVLAATPDGGLRTAAPGDSPV